MEDLKIIYRYNPYLEAEEPKGIRDNSGYILFFPEVMRFHNQDERYKEEFDKKHELADFILKSLLEK